MILEAVKLFPKHIPVSYVIFSNDVYLFVVVCIADLSVEGIHIYIFPWNALQDFFNFLGIVLLPRCLQSANCTENYTDGGVGLKKEKQSRTTTKEESFEVSLNDRISSIT